MVVVTLSAPILGVVVCWRNSGPKNQGFFSKLKSLFTKGFWFVFLSAILLFVGLFHNEFYNDAGNDMYVFWFVFSGLVFLISIGANIQTSHGRLADALAMSLGQTLIILVLLIIIGTIIEKLNKKKGQ